MSEHCGAESAREREGEREREEKSQIDNATTITTAMGERGEEEREPVSPTPSSGVDVISPHLFLFSAKQKWDSPCFFKREPLFPPPSLRNLNLAASPRFVCESDLPPSLPCSYYLRPPVDRRTGCSV